MASPLPETNPRLPPELEHAIFEISALSRPIAIPNLMLVAQRVKIWVEPILYRIVYLSDGEAPAEGFPRFTSETFLQAIDRKPPEFFKYAVRYLFLDDPEEVRTLDSILAACTGITSLFAGTVFAENLPILNAMDSLHHLVVSMMDLFGRNLTGCFAQPLFRNITHLELLDSIGEINYSHVATLSLIPHLTHFAFGDSRLCNGFCDLFRLCARLTCIVLLEADSMGDVQVDAALLIEDTRFVAIYRKNWEADSVALPGTGITGRWPMHSLRRDRPEKSIVHVIISATMTTRGSTWPKLGLKIVLHSMSIPFLTTFGVKTRRTNMVHACPPV
ncbi:hypothetical protein B0H11DRAFT_2240189 [Mycena galericulata]|nr:hypothetical protein B0H11DRAFT_2240189 [Mycena galericulata]